MISDDMDPFKPQNNSAPAQPPQPLPPAEPLLSVPPPPQTGLEVFGGQPETTQPSAPQAPLIATTPPSTQPTYEKRNWAVKIFKWASFGVAIWLVALFLNALVFQSYYVEGLSMHPTLDNNDRLVVNKLPETMASLREKLYIPSRGEIVIIHSDDLMLPGGNPDQIVKRVIGLPGDRVVIKNGLVMIYNPENPNGLNIDEELKLNLEPTYTSQPLDVRVPAGELFVLGDNRAAGGSLDSRVIGTIPAEKVVGQLLLRILPITSLRVF